MKLYRLLIFALALNTLTALAQPVYDCHRLNGKLTIDGRLTEQAWEQAVECTDFQDIRGESFPLPKYHTSLRMLWDDDYLYIGAELEEPYVRASVTEHDDIIYHDNDFEVFIDAFGDSKLYSEIEVNALGTVMDLLMEKPYCEKGNFVMDWDCKGIEVKTFIDGKINDSTKTDRGWSVEMKIPFKSLFRGFVSPRTRDVWRMNFSRVEWLTKPEENWVWSPTGVVDIHHPDKWGYVRFTGPNGEIAAPDSCRIVKNWMWMGFPKDWSEEQYSTRFRKARECGIAAVLFEGYDENIYRLCKEAGMEAHYWRWTMNRQELVKEHPEWYAVSRDGKSCADNPPYVNYYRFLCPSHPEVTEYLIKDYLECAALKYVDGVHLDYIRYPDVILPVSLWKNYGIEQTGEMPEYDFCYCDECRKAFKEQTGIDPLELQYPMENQSWLNFRYDAITKVVTAIYNALKEKGVFVSAAVFPGPSMAKKMVRQEWGNWPLDAFFPMIYNGFYYEGPEWIGRSTAEGVKAVNGKSAVFTGVMCPDLKGDDFIKALDAAYGAGASGISFFAGPDDDQLEMLKEYLQKHHLLK